MVGDVVDASEPPGAVRRRRWSDEIKGRIVAESFAPGAVVSDVARRRGLSPQHLSAWRCAARARLLKLPPDMETPAGCGTSTMRRARSSSSGQACGALGGPGHEFVETRSGPEIDQPDENVGQIGLRVDATEFAGLDERSDAGPILRALIMPGEERILAIENNRADASFDDVGVELDAAVIEEPREPVPMVQGVADVLGDSSLGRDAGELLLEPGLERYHKRLAALLAHRAALIGAAAPDRLLDGIQGGNALERLAGDRRGTPLRDVVEAAPQMNLILSSR
jgi:transposase-like protein